MLHERYPAETLRGALIPRSDYRPHPTIDDRARWGSLPHSVVEPHVSAARGLEGAGIGELPASLFLRFSRDGDRRAYEKGHFARRVSLEVLVVAECMENAGRYLDAIVDLVWAICEETWWGVPAHIRVQRAGNTLPDVSEPVVDLFAAETANLLAWTGYLLGRRLDAVSPLVRPRIEAEIERRVLRPLRERDDFWWMGLVPADREKVNNWNPWICSNWIASLLLVEPDGMRRAETIAKALRTLDRFIDPYPADGGCDEGPGYWGRAGASLFDALDLLYHATGGAIDVYAEPKIREIGAFIYRTHISEDYYVDFADGHALVQPDAVLVHEYGRAIGDADMVRHGAWLAARQRVAEHGYARPGALRAVNLQRLLRTLFGLQGLPSGPAAAPQPRDVWLPGIEVMVARDAGGTDAGFFLAAKGGHNAESHNHNDVGSFIVYLDGLPLLVDAGVEAYTAKTFGPDRYSIWTMRSPYHTLLPVIGGQEQLPGSGFRAREVACESDDRTARFELDIAPAYAAEAGVASWRRSIVLERGIRVAVTDRYELAGPREVALSVLTPCRVDVAAPGTILLSEHPLPDGRRSAAGRFSYDGALFKPTVDEVVVTDEQMGADWGDRLCRVTLTTTSPVRSGTLAFTVSR